MKVLLAGGAGFVGHHLSAALSQRGHEVFIADRFERERADHTHLILYLEEPDSIQAVLRTVKPDCIFHLAAQSSVARSWQSPESTLETNVIGSVRLFQAAAGIVPESRFIFIGSGEEYGIHCSEDRPFTEETLCCPRNPYAVSKFSAGQILQLLAERYSMQFVHLRPFNHYGPFQREGFVVADFCAQIVRAEKNQGSRTLRVGNLAAKRDFLYVDDVVSAYCLLAEAENYPHAVYNISMGKAWPIQSILDNLISLSSVPLKVEVDAEKFRPVEVPVLTASHALIRQDFNWRPTIALETGLKKNLDWWRSCSAV